MRGYMFLFVAILFEIAGSALLKLSDGFTNIIPTLLLFLFYGLSFTVLIFALKTISLSNQHCSKFIQIHLIRKQPFYMNWE